MVVLFLHLATENMKFLYLRLVLLVHLNCNKISKKSQLVCRPGVRVLNDLICILHGVILLHMLAVRPRSSSSLAWLNTSSLPIYSGNIFFSFSLTFSLSVFRVLLNDFCGVMGYLSV